MIVSQTKSVVVDTWESLPQNVREWCTKIAVTLGIAILWHYYWIWRQQENRQQQQHGRSKGALREQKDFDSPRKGVSRLILDPLPQDLVLEEKVLGNDDNNVGGESDSSSSSSSSNKDLKMEESGDSYPPLSHSRPIEAPQSLSFSDKGGETEHAGPTDDAPPPAGHDDADVLSSSSLHDTSDHNEAVVVASHNNQQSTRPVFKNTSAEHPGLDAFWYWCDVECSLFRIYSLGRKDGTAVHPPYIPRSRAGHVKVSLHCQNLTGKTIHVYWINYKGKDVFKGTLQPRARWGQISWIEHPWVFRDAETDQILLYYIPDRIIPTCDEQPTIDVDDSDMGVHRFDLMEAPPDSPFFVSVQDSVLPFPSKDHIGSVEKAVDWVLLHMYRMNYMYWDVLVKYLTNILHKPGNCAYRRIRIENPNFNQAVWNTPARGLLLAIGFVEQGAYVELGTSKTLSADQVKQLSSLLFSIAIWRKRDLPSSQPAGADGYGRAGFGRAGAMS